MKNLSTLQIDILKAMTVPPPRVPNAPAGASAEYNNKQHLLHERAFFKPLYGRLVWNGQHYTRNLPGESRPRSRAIEKLERLGLVEVVVVEFEDDDGNKFSEPTSGKGKRIQLTEEGKQYAATLAEEGGAR